MMALITLPCGHTVTEEFIVSAAARIIGARRRKPVGGAMPGAGRPAGAKSARCECGQFTRYTARKVHHVCPEVPDAG